MEAIKKHDIYRECYICGSTQNIQNHHLLEGSMKSACDKFDFLQIDLCLNHHTGTNESVHKNDKLMDAYHRMGQRLFMKHFNCTIADFYDIFGRSFLDEAFIPNETKFRIED